ncbi:MAG: hypothetical protein AAF184_16685 [Pseudomonadota bacterium]
MNDSRARAEEQLIADALRQAYGEGSPCPPPELFLEEDSLSDAQRRDLAAHVSACPACAAERELALAFTDPEDDVDASSDEVEDVLAKLRERREEHTGAAELRARRRWFTSSAPAVPLALAASVLLAAVVVIGGGGLRTPSAPPELPDFTQSPLRGARVELLAPEGQLFAVPNDFTWREVAQATAYRVSVLAVDDSVLWSQEVTGSPLPLPVALREQLHPAVRYRWQVEALGPSNAVAAASALAEFRIDPRYDQD